MAKQLFFIVLVALCCTAAGCSSFEYTVKESQKLYTEYVVPLPTVDVDPEEAAEDADMHLAQLFKPVDQNIYRLRQYLDGTDRRPNDEWLQALFMKFPWISGVMVVDTTGYADFQYPAVAMKEYDVQPLVDFGEAWKDHSMRGYGHNTDMGPEVYLAYPFFEENEWRGLTIVHFDPRKLLEYCPSPDDLIILSQNGVFWSGKYDSQAQSMANLQWDDILESNDYGDYSGAGGDFSWIARNMGHFHLIYAAMEQD